MKCKYDYEDYKLGYALKRAGIGEGFEVYIRTLFGYRKIGFICERNRTEAIKILKGILDYDEHSENKSEG